MADVLRLAREAVAVIADRTVTALGALDGVVALHVPVKKLEKNIYFEWSIEIVGHKLASV